MSVSVCSARKFGRLAVTQLEDRTVPTTVQVLNTNDTGANSLRDAITQINASADATNSITFLSGLVGTITLASNLTPITKSVDITGPGAALVSVSGNGTNQIFNINDGQAGAINVSISGLTLKNGKAANGGAVRNENENVTLQNLVITGNTATGDGGGVFAGGGLVNIMSSSILNNTAPDGAGIRNTGSTFTISASKIENNTATNGNGTGGYFQSGGSAAITDTSISSNQGGNGAGLFVTGGPTSVANSLISANKSTNAATSNGGGLTVAGGQVILKNTTVAGNLANAGGGGIDFESGTLQVLNSTVAFNKSDNDNAGGGMGGGIFVAAGKTVLLTSTIVAKNTNGTTGANPDVSGAADATSSFNLIGIDTGLTGITNGAQNNQIGTTGTPRDPGFDGADFASALQFNGGTTKSIALRSTSNAKDTGTAGGTTTDQRGDPFVRTFGGSTDIGAFELQDAKSLVVTTEVDENDPGYDPADLSLREALRLAGTGAPVITFSPTLSGKTINFTQGRISIDRSVTVTGLGADKLALDGQGLFQLFRIDDGSNGVTSSVKLSGLTLQNAKSDGNTGGTGFGGAFAGFEDITLDSVILKNNQATSDGGAVDQQFGTLKIQNSWIDSNKAAGNGGGVSNFGGGSVIIQNSAITNNKSDSNGGGVSQTAGAGNLVISNSTISGNEAKINGGGVWINNGTLILNNSTVAFNKGESDGAGAGKGGGVSIDGGTATMKSTIVSNNTVGTTGTNPDINGKIDATSSLVQNTTGWDQSGSDAATLKGVDPQLGTLQNNGGPTPTHALPAGSPAIDKGINPDNLATDQRGGARVTGTAADIGAFEFGSTPPAATQAPAITSGAPPAATVGTAYTFTFTASGTPAPTFSANNLPAGLTLNSTTGVLSGTPTTAGTFNFTVTATNGVSPDATTNVSLVVNAANGGGGGGSTTKAPPPPTGKLLVGGPANGTATLFTATNGVYSPGATVTFVPGGNVPIEVAGTGDVNKDGTPDYVGVTAAGANARVVVISGVDGSTVLASFLPYGSSYTNGLTVAVADFTGDGFADVAVAPDAPDGKGIGPKVQIYDGSTLTGGTDNPKLLASFLGLADLSGAADTSFVGGARLGTGDIDGDGIRDLLVTAGSTGGPRVTVWNGKGFAGANGGQPTINPIANLFVFESGQRGGAWVTSGDVNGDGKEDLIFGGGPGGGPRIRIVDAVKLLSLGSQLQAVNLDDPANLSSGLIRNNFFVGDPNTRGGVRLAVRDVDGDGIADLIAGSGEGLSSQVVVFTNKALSAVAGQDGVTPQASQNPIDPFSAVLGLGVYVG